MLCLGVGRGKFRLIFWPDLDNVEVNEDTMVGEVFSENRVVLVMEVVDMEMGDVCLLRKQYLTIKNQFNFPNPELNKSD